MGCIILIVGMAMVAQGGWTAAFGVILILIAISESR